MDRIHITDLEVRGIIGINPEERTNEQRVLINLTMLVDTSAAAASDDIGDTVNYRTVCKRVIAHVETGRPLLVERLAEEIAGICLADPRVEQVEVRVDKPGALSRAASVGVTIVRPLTS